MASHLVIEAADVSKRGLRDAAPHRQGVAPVYNAYARVSADPAFAGRQGDYQALLRPLFMLSFLVDDYLAEENFFGAQSVILSSASSKTAFGLAHLLQAQRQPVRVIGLTSAGHTDFVASLGAMTPSSAMTTSRRYRRERARVAFVDMAGNSAVRARLHQHFGDLLVYSGRVGLTHQDAPREETALPGAKPNWFSPPTRSASAQRNGGRRNRKAARHGLVRFRTGTGARDPPRRGPWPRRRRRGVPCDPGGACPPKSGPHFVALALTYSDHASVDGLHCGCGISLCPLSSQCRHAACSMSGQAASQPMRGPGALLERTRLARRLAGTGTECGLPAAELLPTVTLVVAGCDQGGVPRPRQHRRALRPRGAQPHLRDAAAQRRIAEILRQADHASPPSPGSTCSCAIASSASIAVDDDLTFDHIVPRSKGGQTTWENVVAACSPC